MYPVDPGMTTRDSPQWIRSGEYVIQLRLRPAPSPGSGHGLNLRIRVRQLDLPRRLLLDTIAVHIDGLEDTLGQILLHRRRELRHQEVQENGELLPLGVGVGQDGGEEAVGAGEGLGLALEV